MKFNFCYIIAYTEWLTDFSLQICIIIKTILLHLMRVNSVNSFFFVLCIYVVRHSVLVKMFIRLLRFR